MSTRPEISTSPPVTTEVAHFLCLARRDLVAGSEEESAIIQTGGFVISSDAPAWPQHLHASEPRIETFTVTIEGETVTTEPTGMDTELIAGFATPAQAMAEKMVEALSGRGVQVKSPGWLTASITPADQITGLAHMDDDMYMPGDGVGAVGICGSLDGPRIATGSIEAPLLMGPTQVTLPEPVIDAFTSSELPHQQIGANELVVFPQFGQLHAGPLLTNVALETMRSLMVFRLRTVPNR